MSLLFIVPSSTQHRFKTKAQQVQYHYRTLHQHLCYKKKFRTRCDVWAPIEKPKATVFSCDSLFKVRGLEHAARPEDAHPRPLPSLPENPSLQPGGQEIPQVRLKEEHSNVVNLMFGSVLNEWMNEWMNEFRGFLWSTKKISTLCNCAVYFCYLVAEMSIKVFAICYGYEIANKF